MLIIKSIFQYLHYCRNIDVEKFNGLQQLNIILNEFVEISKEEQNPLYFNINTYMNKHQYIYQNTFGKYIKINEKFYSHYSNSLISIKFKFILFIINFIHFNAPLCLISVLDNKDNSIIIIFDFFLAAFINLIYYCNTKCCQKNFFRIDVIYSNDFNQIFIGPLCNEKKYFPCSIFNINDIDKFILQKKKKRSITYL